MGSIIAGVVLIGIGLVRGDSVFYGDFSVLTLVFDGLGLFWLGKGVYSIVQAKSAS